jgi:CRP-like cAMP-binding protein
VLESKTFQEGEDIIREGDAGEEFFLIESGTAAAIKGGDQVVKQYSKGDYFGGQPFTLKPLSDCLLTWQNWLFSIVKHVPLLFELPQTSSLSLPSANRHSHVY